MFRSLALVAGLAVVLASPPSLAARQSPERSALSDAAGAGAVRVVAADSLDVEEMAKRAIGDRAWATFTGAERQAVMAPLRTLLQRAHARHQRRLKAAGAVWDAGAERNGRIAVKARPGLTKSRLDLTYELEKQASAWVVTNMISDEVSTVESLNRQIRTVLNRGDGVDALVAVLREAGRRE